MEQLARCRASQQSRFHALAMELGMTLDSVLFCQVNPPKSYLYWTSSRVHEHKKVSQKHERLQLHSIV